MNDSIEYYYDHYKDSFEQIKSHINNRERFFIYAVLFLFASMFTTFNPAYVLDKSNAIGKVQLGIDLNLAYYIINSVLLFLSLWFLLRYYQTVLLIENLYIYIHNMEDKLCTLISDYQINRESKSYLSSYPILKNCIHYFYFIVFPFIIIISVAIKGYWEIFERELSIPTLALVFDIFCIVLIIIMTLLYLSWIHFKDFKQKNN